MAKKLSVKKKRGKGPYGFLKILCGLTILATCAVLFVGGTRSGARGALIVYECLGATVAISVVFKVVIRVVASCEEINRG